MSQGRSKESSIDLQSRHINTVAFFFSFSIFSGCYEADRYSLCVRERGDGQLSEGRLHV